jgi:hypothetical protein
LKTTAKSIVVTEEISFFGHQMVRATHGRTIEITTEGHLTPSGDCIVGVHAEKGVARLSEAMKSALRSDSAEVTITLVAPGGEFSFAAHGSGGLTFESETDMVIRKSSFVCGRTLAIHAAASANEIPRDLVRSLKSPESVGLLRIDVHV